MRIKIDVDQMQEALDSEVIEVENGLTREEKRTLLSRFSFSKDEALNLGDSMLEHYVNLDQNRVSKKKSKSSKNKRCNLTIDWVEQETGEFYEKPKVGKSY